MGDKSSWRTGSAQTLGKPAENRQAQSQEHHRRDPEKEIQQVVAYAVEVGTDQAFLVYPTTDIEPMDIPVGDRRVGSLAFDVSDEPDKAGKRFLGALTGLLG